MVFMGHKTYSPHKWTHKLWSPEKYFKHKQDPPKAKSHERRFQINAFKDFIISSRFTSLNGHCLCCDSGFLLCLYPFCRLWCLFQVHMHFYWSYNTKSDTHRHTHKPTIIQSLHLSIFVSLFHSLVQTIVRTYTQSVPVCPGPRRPSLACVCVSNRISTSVRSTPAVPAYNALHTVSARWRITELDQ